MNALRNLRIGPRLGLAFAALLAALCIVASFGAAQTSRVNDSVVDIGTHWMASVELLSKLDDGVQESRRASLRHTPEIDVGAKRQQQVRRDALVGDAFVSAQQGCEKTITSPERAKRL